MKCRIVIRDTPWTMGEVALAAFLVVITLYLLAHVVVWWVSA